MIETRLALPQRSPKPLMVPWTWRTPSSTAAMVLATATSLSLCAWMPKATLGSAFCARGARAARIGARHRAAVGVAEDDDVGAGVGRALQRGERVLGVVGVAVEEVLGVVDDLVEVLLQEADACRG